MIVPMQHVTILCLENGKKQTLEVLRELGLLHITQSSVPPETHAAETDAVRQVEQALDALELAHTHIHDEPATPTSPPQPSNILDLVTELLHRQHAVEEQLADCHHQKHIIEPFGNFDPACLDDLRAKGIHVKLLRVSDPQTLAVPEGVVVREISNSNKGHCMVAISQQEFEIDGSIAALPEKSLAEIETELDALQTELADIHAELCELSVHIETLQKERLKRKDQLAFVRTQAALAEHGKIVSLAGFCPRKKLENIWQVANQHGWAITARDPKPGEDVPTLLQMPRWVEPIKAVFQVISILPGYWESDISSIFLIFFSIFFAILIGDAGYGLLFLAITIFARLKLPKAPAYPFVLFAILSTTTLIWGSLTGNWFGIAPDSLPALLRAPHLDVFKGAEARDLVIRICFIIGALHLTVAHIWNAIALAPALKALAQIGWIGLVWSMFFTALNLVLAEPVPAFFAPMLIVSVVLILLFMTAPKDFKSDWIHHAMFPLSMVNCFVDIVSYIRLFAVGLASLSVAASFNDMAMQIGFSRIWTVPVFALILLLGHGLNIVLCALGILVHGVRLNTLEFSMHKNVEWKGFAYKPFARISQE